MGIQSEKQAQKCIALWQADSLLTQFRALRLAIESQELGLMYYAQKGKDQAVGRTVKILALLRERLHDLGFGENAG